jgi:hypothetical protein
LPKFPAAGLKSAPGRTDRNAKLVIPDPGGLVEIAVRFIEHQAAGLLHGLAHAMDRAAVASVVAAHDAAHEEWLTVIATTKRTLGPAAAQRVAALYSFHGRVIGCLERGVDPGLGNGVAAEVHRVLERCLERLTLHAVTTLQRGQAHADAPAQAATPPVPSG